MGDKFSFTIKLYMDTANDSQKEKNLIPRRPSSPKSFENTIPNRNYLIHFAQCFLLRRKMQWLFVRCEQGLFLEQRGIVWCLCTSRVAIRTRNTFVVCALRALLFIRAKISLVICAPHAVLLKRGILCFLCTSRGAFRTRNTLFFMHFARCF